VAGGVLFCAGVLVISLTKPAPSGNPQAQKIEVSPEIESAMKPLFKVFYAYHDNPRGMAAFTFKDESGQSQTLESYQRGRFLVLNFWASWCAPCAKELPTLQALQAKRGGARFVVLAASADFAMQSAQIRGFMKKNNAPDLPLAILDESATVWEIMAAGLPITFIISPKGRVLYKMLGDADWNRPEITALIDDLLANDVDTTKN
jgi:thiol-disulfide isomerase/thioredoxin